jgi:phosphopantothenate synthetase
MAAPSAPQPKTSAPPPLPNQQPTGQSAQASNVNSMDNILRAITVVQQIMTEFSGAVSKEEKILKLMEQNGQ